MNERPRGTNPTRQPLPQIQQGESRPKQREVRLDDKQLKRLYRAWLISLAVVALIVVTIGGFIGYNISQRQINDRYAFNTIEVVRVQRGDTIWTLVQPLINSSHDIRRVVRMVQDMNDLTSATIFPGDVLILPDFRPPYVPQFLDTEKEEFQ